jgi:hypothetical protein
MKYQIKEIYSLLDKLLPNQKREITLPNSDIKICINQSKNKTFNSFYNRSKIATISCICCGVEPSYVDYSKNHGIRLFISDTNYMTLDHNIPRSIGGLTTKENLNVMCYQCNNSKGVLFEKINTTKVYELSDVFSSLIIKYEEYKDILILLKNKFYVEGVKGTLTREVFENKVFTELKNIINTLEIDNINSKLILQ